jgi:5'-3' exonuclease
MEDPKSVKYIIIDTANLFFKSKYIASRSQSDDERVGMALHLTLQSANTMVRKFGANATIHVVFALEGRSWRKQFYEPYKRNRVVKEAAKTPSEVELDDLFNNTYNEFIKYLNEKTNVSVIRCNNAEADDIIARFIQIHPNNEHVIISSDTDFDQLIAPNVQRYNSLANQLITIDGYFDENGKPVIDNKTKEHKKLEDPQFILFEKCMRGDSTDNIFSAYPGVRKKSTKKTVGLIEAYADREKKGFNWNNVMLQSWVDHNGVQHKVKDDYERNRILIDLTMQPQDIKDNLDEVITNAVNKPQVSQIGTSFLLFCGKNQLIKISESITFYIKWLNQPYIGPLKSVKEAA